MTRYEQIASHRPPHRTSRVEQQRFAPSSAHHAGHYPGLHPEDEPGSRETYEDDEEEWSPVSVPRSAIRYHSVSPRAVASQRPRDVVVHRVPRRASTFTESETKHLPRPRHRPHWLLIVGFILFVLVVGYVLLTAFFGWWQETQDTWHYGYPRTYQMDAMVGHSDSAQHPSHFIALNLHGQVEVIEFLGGDASHAKVYVGPTLMGTNADLAVVTLSFQDVNGDGKPDLVINVHGGHFVFLNIGTQFRPVTASDNVNLSNP